MNREEEKKGKSLSKRIRFGFYVSFKGHAFKYKLYLETCTSIVAWEVKIMTDRPTDRPKNKPPDRQTDKRGHTD